MMAECPVCNKHVDEVYIASHVDAHFEEDEPARKRIRRMSSLDLVQQHSTQHINLTTSIEDTIDNTTKRKCNNNITEKKCDNCGVVVPSHDWIRHSAVHDDEAIAVCTLLPTFSILSFLSHHSLSLPSLSFITILSQIIDYVSVSIS